MKLAKPKNMLRTVETKRIINMISKKLNIPKIRVKQIIEEEHRIIKTCLLEGKAVNLTDFVGFIPFVKKERVYQSRKTGQLFDKKEQMWVKFKVRNKFKSDLANTKIPDAINYAYKNNNPNEIRNRLEKFLCVKKPNKEVILSDE